MNKEWLPVVLLSEEDRMSQEMGGKNRLWRSALFSQLTVSFKAHSTLVNGEAECQP